MNSASTVSHSHDEKMTTEEHIRNLLDQMTLAEKIGQMQQVDATGDMVSDDLRRLVLEGRVGSVINHSNLEVGNELQRIATEESRLGIPMLCARDVIHGYKTVMPIPLGQAASWNPGIVREGARVAALEARRNGLNWTFAPMIDISRDPRWGRIAESLGEDPYLTGLLGAAMSKGFQGDELDGHMGIAACAKHFAGYGASEGGIDYNTTNIPENELRNIYLPPFKTVLEAGCATIMSSFGDIDGIPATANEFLMQDILRDEWQYHGMVISDWDSVRQLSVHGLTEDDRDSAFQAARAGIDMEMAGDAYANHLADLINEGKIDIAKIDRMVANILRLKINLGLFDNPYTDPDDYPDFACAHALETAKQAAIESAVLLKNEHKALPINQDDLSSIAVIGPMANAPADQLGTWVFDGDPDLSITPLQAIRDTMGDDVIINYAPGLSSTRSKSMDLFKKAIDTAYASDMVIMFAGEEAILSGEAHCRADITLPGAQADLIKSLKKTGKTVVLVIMAGRPLALENVVGLADAILYAWHPGTMAGPALCDLLFGDVSPTGKLPVTFPKVTGQIPIYYNHKNTGRPPSRDKVMHIDDIEDGATQTSFGMTAFHLDAGYEPLFPFGYGLSYTEFSYEDLSISNDILTPEKPLQASITLTNSGKSQGTETVQLYIRDLAGSITRPVKELKAFQKVTLEPGQSKTVSFELTAEDLAFYGRNKKRGLEAGKYHLWIGGDSNTEISRAFSLVIES